MMEAGVLESVTGREICLYYLAGLNVVQQLVPQMVAVMKSLREDNETSHEVPSGLPSPSSSFSLPFGDLDLRRSAGCDLATGGDVDGGEPGPS